MKLGRNSYCRPAERWGGAPGAELRRLAALWKGERREWFFERKQEALETTTLPEIERADRHLTRLWAAAEVERLQAMADQPSLDQAIKLALQMQLVTPVSGAVVLETAQQYARHGLSPVDPESTPQVPEPTAALLLGGGVCWLLNRRWRSAEN